MTGVQTCALPIYGIVNGFDLLKVRQCFEKSSTELSSEGESCLDVDIDRDGFIGDFELDAVQKFYLQKCEITQTCTDSDGRKDYEEYGTVYWTDGYNQKEYDDRCCIENENQDGYACGYETGEYLSEGFCSDEGIDDVLYKCPNGCSNGACIINSNNSLNLILEDVNFYPQPENFEGGNLLIKPIFDYSGLKEGTNFFMKVRFYLGDEQVEGCGILITYENGGFINVGCDVNELEPNEEYSLKLELDSENVLVESNEYDNGITKVIYLGRVGDILEEGECYDSDSGKSFYKAGQTYDEGEFLASYDYCDGKTLVEYYCKEERKDYSFREEVRYECPNGCNAGACIKESFDCRSGCILEDKCYPFGFRKNEKYCSGEINWEEQKQGDESCDNNFECSSNVCVAGECVSQGLLEKIIAWFKKLFGAE